MKPRVKLYLCDEEHEGIFGDGRWRLLRAIADEGSIRAAARRLGRGYRKAWGDIERAEQALGRPLVERSRGGAEGGTAALTEFGRRLLEGWERCRDAVGACMEAEFERHLRSVIEGRGERFGPDDAGREEEKRTDKPERQDHES